jgi:hypothetical protein
VLYSHTRRDGLEAEVHARLPLPIFTSNLDSIWLTTPLSTNGRLWCCFALTVRRANCMI